MANYCVYCHINNINGKRYIGLTGEKDPTQRWGSNGINYKACTAFYNAIKKYGWNNFTHIILKDKLTQEEAIYWEKQYIKEYNTISPNGYNLTSGGEINKEISEETRQRLRDSHLGYKPSIESCKKMSESRKGHIGYNRKPVWMCDKKTHQRIKYFDSSIDAEKYLNIKGSYTHIGHVCRGERLSAYGYFWEFAKEGEINGDT